MIASIVLGLEAVHDAGYLHRDLKPENLIFDGKGYLKIADLSRSIKMNYAQGRITN